MAFAIMRTKKLKSAAAVVKSLKHTFREEPTPNADPKLTPKNEAIGGKSAAEGIAAIRKRWPDKLRKNGVLVIEYLITASPEAFKKHGGKIGKAKETEYFNKGLEWLRKRHGAENVVLSAIHRDETTPHMVAYVVPRVGDKLNARHFLGGSTAMSQMQDSFYESCGQPFALERGIKGSKAKHTTVSQFYAKARSSGEIPELSKSDYAAAAIGIETDAFKNARQAMKQAADASILANHERKATQARAKALKAAEEAAAVQTKAAEVATIRAKQRVEMSANDAAGSKAQIGVQVGKNEELRAQMAKLEAEKAEIDGQRLSLAKQVQTLKAELRKANPEPDRPRL